MNAAITYFCQFLFQCSIQYSIEWLLCSLYEERKKLGGIFKQSIATSVLFKNHVTVEHWSSNQSSTEPAVFVPEIIESEAETDRGRQCLCLCCRLTTAYPWCDMITWLLRDNCFSICLAERHPLTPTLRNVMSPTIRDSLPDNWNVPSSQVRCGIYDRPVRQPSHLHCNLDNNLLIVCLALLNS